MCEGPGKGLLTTDSHPGTCRLPVGPIVLFACQIWGVNLMDIKKGLNTAGKGVASSSFLDLLPLLLCA